MATTGVLALMIALSSSAATLSVDLSFSRVRHCSIASFCCDLVSVVSVVVDRCADTTLDVAIRTLMGLPPAWSCDR